MSDERCPCWAGNEYACPDHGPLAYVNREKREDPLEKALSQRDMFAALGAGLSSQLERATEEIHRWRAIMERNGTWDAFCGHYTDYVLGGKETDGNV